MRMAGGKGLGSVGDLSTFMRRLRSEREAQTLTQEWIADKAGVTKQAISQYENDTTGRARPSVDVMRKWIRALELGNDWLQLWEELDAVENVMDELARVGIQDEHARRAVAMVIRSAIRESRGRAS